jgi:hypothetical protein
MEMHKALYDPKFMIAKVNFALETYKINNDQGDISYESISDVLPSL